MGRPKPSDEVREFCSEFASTVTVRSRFRYDWVARIGKHSIYSALSLAARKVDSCLLVKALKRRIESTLANLSFRQACCLNEDNSVNRYLEAFSASTFLDFSLTIFLAKTRSGISELQLNKDLQRIGFACIRVRMRSIDRYGSSFHLEHFELCSSKYCHGIRKIMNKIERRTPYTPSSSLSGYRRSVGSLLFDQRRWLNPNAEADRALLQQVLHLCLPKKQTVSKLQDHDYHFPVVSIKARSDRSLLGTAPSIHSIPQISLSRAPLEGRGTADCMPGSRRSSPCRSPPSSRSSARCGYSPCNTSARLVCASACARALI